MTSSGARLPSCTRASAGDGSEGPAKSSNERVKESHWRSIRQEPGSESRTAGGGEGGCCSRVTARPPECSEAPRAAHTGWREPALTQSGKGQTGERARPRLEGQQDSILPQPRAQVLCTPSSLTEKQLPRLLREPKGRKPALPGQTGDDIVASLSCKFLNTTSCQGPLPTAPGLHADDLEPGWECQARAPPPAQPWPADRKSVV